MQSIHAHAANSQKFWRHRRHARGCSEHQATMCFSICDLVVSRYEINFSRRAEWVQSPLD